MYINRGNHEAKDMNRTYGFEGEAKQKHGEQAYKVGQIICLSKEKMTHSSVIEFLFF